MFFHPRFSRSPVNSHSCSATQTGYVISIAHVVGKDNHIHVRHSPFVVNVGLQNDDVVLRVLLPQNVLNLTAVERGVGNHVVLDLGERARLGNVAVMHCLA